MPLQQCLPRRPQPGRIHRAFQVKEMLHHIHVRGCRIVEHMEQQPLLQRRQRPDLGQPARGRGLQFLDLVLI